MIINDEITEGINQVGIIRFILYHKYLFPTSVMGDFNERVETIVPSVEITSIENY